MISATPQPGPETHLFGDDGAIPNNPALPLLIYRGAIGLEGCADPEQAIERVFGRHRWGDMWRNGVYPFVHYHSSIHEAMGVARGRARVRFGGDAGKHFDLAAGDVCVLPAGTGHQCLSHTEDFSVVGAYPPSGRYDLCRGSKAEHDKALDTIPQTPRPTHDPVFGARGPLVDLWTR